MNKLLSRGVLAICDAWSVECRGFCSKGENEELFRLSRQLA